MEANTLHFPCVTTAFEQLDCVVLFKGALCSFGEGILIRREKSPLTDFLWLNKLNKHT